MRHSEVVGYTPKEVAVYFDVTARTVLNYIYRGNVSAINVGKGRKNARWRITSFRYFRKLGL